MSEKAQALTEEVKGLTILELVEAVKVMEKELGVSAATPVAAAGATPAAGGVTGGAEEKTDLDVIIIGPGQEKVRAIKIIKDITGLGLKEVKALVDRVPKAIKEGAPQAGADEIKAKLEEIGTTVEIK